MGASPMLLLVTQTARTSIVSSSIPMCILRQMRQMRRLGPPVARQHMLACVRGVFANATATSIRGLRSSMAISQLLCGVQNRSTACRTAIAPEISNRRMSR